MTIEERLENIERELGRQKRRNRWLLGAVLVIAVISIIALAQMAGTSKQIRARSILIEDEKGQRRAWLGVDNDGPTLSLWDENGETRAILVVGKGGPGLVLSDEKGRRRAAMSVVADIPGLALSDENGKGLALLAVIAGKPCLSLGDEKGQDRASLNVRKEGPTLILRDEKGNLRFVAGTAKTVSPDGKTIEYPESSLILYGSDGKVIWSAIK